MKIVGVSSLLPLCGFWDQTQVIRLGGKVSLRTHLTSLTVSFTGSHKMRGKVIHVYSIIIYHKQQSL